MRKFYLVLTTLLIFSALLTSCGAAKSPANAGETVSEVSEEISQPVSEEELSASQLENSEEERASSASAGSSKKPAAGSQPKEEKQQQNTLPPADVSQPEQPDVQQQQSSTQQQEETPQPYPSSAEAENTLPAGKMRICISVECSSAVAAKNELALSVAPNGIMLPKTEMFLDENATVYDALKNSGLVISAQKGPFGMYVSSIQSLAQKACGQNSGWVYTVNGNNINISCSAYKLRNGDEVRWFYTLG